MTPKLTIPQREALTRLHDIHKNLWKSYLREIWTGAAQVVRGDNAILFDLRDSHGERWLANVSMSNLQIVPLAAHAALVLERLRNAPVIRALAPVPLSPFPAPDPSAPFPPTPHKELIPGLTYPPSLPLPPGCWSLVDTHKVRDRITPVISALAWGGTLGALQRRGLYHPEPEHRARKSSGFGWVRGEGVHTP